MGLDHTLDPARQARRVARLALCAVVLVIALLPLAAHGTAIGELDQLAPPSGCIDETGDGVVCADGIGLQSAFAVTTSPDGRHVYAVSDVGALTVFDRDAGSGALTQKPGVVGCIAATGDGVTCGVTTGLAGTRGVVVSPDGDHVYVAANGSNALGVFDRDPDTGALTQKPGVEGCIADAGDGVTCADAVGLDGPRAIAISADGADVYVASQFGDTVTVFDRDAATGALAQKPGVAGCIAEAGDGVTCADGAGLDVPLSLALSPDGAHVYVASFLPGAITTFDRDPATGTLTQKAGTAGCVTDSGDGVTCADGTALGALLGVALSPDGRSAYAVSSSYNAVAVLDRDAATGVLTQKAGAAGCVRNGGGLGCATAVGLASPVTAGISPDGANLYATSTGSKALTLFDRDRVTGVITQKAAPQGCVAESGDGVTCRDGEGLDGARSPAFSPDGRNLYLVANTSSALTTFARGVPELTASDAAVDFGTRAPGTGPGSSRGITLENTGTGPLVVEAATLTGAGAAQFTLAAAGCVTTLAPGASCVLQIAYDPSSAGAHAATLAVESDDPVTPAVEVALSGTAAVPEPVAPAPAPTPLPTEPVPVAAPAAPLPGSPQPTLRVLSVRVLAARGARASAPSVGLLITATAPGTAVVRVERRSVPTRRGRASWRVVRTRTVPLTGGVSRVGIGSLPAGTYRVVVRPAGAPASAVVRAVVRVGSA